MKTLHINITLMKLFSKITNRHTPSQECGADGSQGQAWEEEYAWSCPLDGRSEHNITQGNWEKERAGACHRRMKTKNKFTCYTSKRTYTTRSKSSLNCIYFATCSDCPKVWYVGQTFAQSTANGKVGSYHQHCGTNSGKAAGVVWLNLADKSKF